MEEVLDHHVVASKDLDPLTSHSEGIHPGHNQDRVPYLVWEDREEVVHVDRAVAGTEVGDLSLLDNVEAWVVGEDVAAYHGTWAVAVVAAVMSHLFYVLSYLCFHSDYIHLKLLSYQLVDR